MKTLFVHLALMAAITFTSCGKEKSTNSDTTGGTTTTTSGTLQAKVDGKLVSYKVESATLIRATSTNQKRVDLLGIATDGSSRIILTIGENTSTGNAMSVKPYTVRLFNDDNPLTAFDESDDSEEAFFTYSTTLGGTNWLTEVYSENGEIVVTACSATTTTISGTFKGVSVNLNSNATLTFAEGRFDNIKYAVLN